MTTTTTPPRTTSSGLRPARRTRPLAVLGAAAATLAVWAVAGPLAGVDLAVRLGAGADVQQVGPVAVALVAVLAGLAGWAALALLERITPQRSRMTWTILALVVLALSLTGPLTSGTTAAAIIALLGMHLAAAAVLVPTLARTAARS